MPQEKLPTERDFCLSPGELDGYRAWKSFGGLTIEQASLKFRSDPSHFQEDFMFMGGKAFAFYFPVIEEFLRSVPDEAIGDDYEAWILAHGIKFHFDGNDLPDVRHLIPRVKALAHFVDVNIARFGCSTAERSRVAEAWTELLRRIQAVDVAL